MCENLNGCIFLMNDSFVLKTLSPLQTINCSKLQPFRSKYFDAITIRHKIVIIIKKIIKRKRKNNIEVLLSSRCTHACLFLHFKEGHIKLFRLKIIAFFHQFIHTFCIYMHHCLILVLHLFNIIKLILFF